MFALAKGPKGPKGERGAKGERGMPVVQRQAIVYLFALSVTLTLLIGAAFVHYVDASQAAQRQQSLIVERKICTTMGRLAALKPPAGNAAANPSRAYEQQLHATLDQLGPDLGC
jgi:hypothetical protein